MRRFIVFLFFLAASVFLGWKIAQDPGYALFSYQHWSVEVPLWLAVLGVIILFFFGYCILRIIDSISLSLYRWRNWRRWQNKNKSYNKTHRGLLELVEGHWKSAEHYLMEGVRQSDAPLINYLGAAKAAHEQGDYVKRNMLLTKAHEIAPQAEVAIGLTEAKLQLQQGQLESAQAILLHLQTLAPKHPFVLKLLERLYIRLGDWQALLQLLPRLQKAHVVDDAYAKQFEAKLYCELLDSTNHKEEGLKALQSLWAQMPRRVQSNPTVLAHYAKHVVKYPEVADELEVSVRKAIGRSWDISLVRLYGVILAKDPVKQLSRAEGWHKEHLNQADLLLTLGRLSMRAQLWGKAKSYFEESLKLSTDPQTYVEYGKLLELLGEQRAAVENYREGLARIAAQRDDD